MSAAAAFTIALSLCAVAITAMLAAGTVLGGNMREKVYRCYFAMLVFCCVGACAEAGAVLLIGRQGDSVAVLFTVLDFASYVFGSLMGIAFSLYLYEYLSTKVRLSKTPFVLLVLLYGAHIPLIGAGQLAHLFTWLDEANQFQPHSFVLLTQLLPLTAILLTMAVTCRHIKALRTREWVSILLYTLVPGICYLIEYFFNDTYSLWVTYFGTALAMLMIYVNIQVDFQRVLSERDAELAESRISIMLSQIQPHFLYNSLTAIAALCDVAPEKVKPAVQNFAHYLRGNLDSLKEQKLIPFIDELGHVETYLALEKLRYGDSLQVRYDIALDDFMLPPLTVQPIVENAVKHGVVGKGGGAVCVCAARAGDTVRITVADDGAGFDPAARGDEAKSHVGIDNVGRRLLAQCGGALEIDSAPGAGTTAVITIPYIAERGRFHEYSGG